MHLFLFDVAPDEIEEEACTESCLVVVDWGLGGDARFDGRASDVDVRPLGSFLDELLEEGGGGRCSAELVFATVVEVTEIPLDCLLMLLVDRQLPYRFKRMLTRLLDLL